MGVKLAEVLKQAKAPLTSDHEVQFVEGFITPDVTEGFTRIYPDVTNRSRYIVLRNDDVGGDLHKFSDVELAHSGFVGQERYRVPIRLGAIVHIVTVSSFRAGMGRGLTTCGDGCTFNVDCSGSAACTKCSADFKCTLP